MVFTSLVNFANTVRIKSTDAFWRKRRVFKMTAHFRGKKRNCYTIAVRYCNRALAYATQHRQLKKEDARITWETRLNGACQEHGFSRTLLMESLERQNIFLNRKSLANLAVWEPRTFQSIVNLAWCTAFQEKLKGVDGLGPPPKNVSVPKIEDN